MGNLTINGHFGYFPEGSASTTNQIIYPYPCSIMVNSYFMVIHGLLWSTSCCSPQDKRKLAPKDAAATCREAASVLQEAIAQLSAAANVFEATPVAPVAPVPQATVGAGVPPVQVGWEDGRIREVEVFLGELTQLTPETHGKVMKRCEK